VDEEGKPDDAGRLKKWEHTISYYSPIGMQGVESDAATVGIEQRVGPQMVHIYQNTGPQNQYDSNSIILENKKGY